MNEQQPIDQEEYLANYLSGVLEARTAEAASPEDQPIVTYGAGHIGPTFWADAPWRLEPGIAELPFTFLIRDGENVEMRLEEIAIYEAAADDKKWADKDWALVEQFEPADQEYFTINEKYWVYRPTPAGNGDLGPPPTIPLERFQTAVPGGFLLLKVLFKGSQAGLLFRRSFEKVQYLKIHLAIDPLPLRDSPHWYYGDTHYHSSYTNDLKEFGNPIADTRAAGECIGLDWLVITDHSVDLDDQNPYWEGTAVTSRWAALGHDVQAYSDDRLRILRGEEVSVIGHARLGDDTLHVLVFGPNFQNMIPGAFIKSSLLAGVEARLKKFAPDLYQHLFGPIYKLEEVLTGINKKGQSVAALKSRSVQAQGAVAFAAHPASMAQGPGGTWLYDDLIQPIHGMEAWNSRIASHTDQEEDPFDNWEAVKDWDERANKVGIDMWDQMLRHRVGLEDPRYVLLGGSDAHGSFNYSQGWWIDWDGIRADDNCLGKVRTLLFLSHRTGERRAPTEHETVEAMRTGSCVVTDGPVTTFSLNFAGQEFQLGQVMKLQGNGAVEIKVQAKHPTEFGPVTEIQIIYFFQGMSESKVKLVPYQDGYREVIVNSLPAAAGYVRLAVETQSELGTFRCFTNPIWIQSEQPGQRQLQVNCLAW